jgi:hypothetical protein
VSPVFLTDTHPADIMQPNMHLAAFYASLAASQTDLAIAPVVDPQLSTNNNGMLLPENMRIGMALASGLGVTQGRFNVPSLRVNALPRVHPVNKALYPVDDAPIMKWREQGPRVLQTETFQAQLTSDATAGPNDSYMLAWLYAGAPRKIAGDITTIRATSTVTAATGSWVVGALTLEQDLPSGRFAVVGLDAIGTTAQAMRLRFPGGGYCPGVSVQQAAGQFFLDTFRCNNAGFFGEFMNSTPPQIDVLGTTGAVTLTIFMDIIKTG